MIFCGTCAEHPGIDFPQMLLQETSYPISLSHKRSKVNALLGTAPTQCLWVSPSHPIQVVCNEFWLEDKELLPSARSNDVLLWKGTCLNRFFIASVLRAQEVSINKAWVLVEVRPVVSKGECVVQASFLKKTLLLIYAAALCGSESKNKARRHSQNV